MKTLSTNKQIGAAFLGVILWFIFMVVIRFSPWIFDGGIRSAITFLVAIPLNIVMITLLKSILSLDDHTVFEGITIATFTAMLFDGMVFTFVPQWYGSSTEHALLGAGFILWGAAWGMIVAWFTYKNNALKLDQWNDR